jgi:integrase
VIQVRRSVCDKTAQVKVCKDGEDRFVPMSRQLAEWLRRHLEATALEGQLKGWTPEQRALVLPNSRGKIGRYSTFLEHVWQPLLLKAGLRYRKAHSMRHTFAAWALEGRKRRASSQRRSSRCGTGWAMHQCKRRRAIFTAAAPATRGS